MAPLAGQPPLVYDRVGQNRRRTWILIILAFGVLLPSVAAAGYLLSRLAIVVASTLAGAIGSEYSVRLMVEYHRHAIRFASVTTGGVSALLGLLFWAIASSPGSRLLVQAGAWPASALAGCLFGGRGAPAAWKTGGRV